MVRFIPGLIAAAGAYVSLIFLSWIDSVTIRFLLFLAIYFIAAWVIDSALRDYGE